MQRDSFIFYRSFFEATKPLGKEDKAELFDAICEFALNHNEVELSPLPSAMFTLIKPQLEANYKRYESGLKFGKLGAEHGKKGGRPKKENPQKTLKKPSNENDNVNDNNNNILYIELNKEEYNIYNDIKQEFIDYWNEPDKKGKPKWMKEKTWDLGGRLRTWARNKKTNFGRKEIPKFTNPIEEFAHYMSKDDYNGLKQIYKERYGNEWKKPFFDTKSNWVAYDFGMAFSN